jgi:hypothetical protein
VDAHTKGENLKIKITACAIEQNIMSHLLKNTQKKITTTTTKFANY